MPKKDYNTKDEITKLVTSIVNDLKKKDTFYNSNAFDKKVKDITAKSIENLYRSLWVKRQFWKNDI